MNQPILFHRPVQMSTLKRNRTSILRPGKLVEIQGSYWPRVLILSERGTKSSGKKSSKAKSSSSSSIKISRRIKQKDMMRRMKKLSPVLPSSSVQQRPSSPSFEASPASLSSISAAFDQNTSPCWKPFVPELSKIKRSSFTGKPIFVQTKNASKPIGQSSIGRKGPRRRKSPKAVVRNR